jgi:hypothetical protein
MTGNPLLNLNLLHPYLSSSDTRDISNLLGRAGFALIAVDVDEVKITYPSIWELMEDLRDMGESNGVLGRFALFACGSVWTDHPTDVISSIVIHWLLHLLFIKVLFSGHHLQSADNAVQSYMAMKMETCRQLFR